MDPDLWTLTADLQRGLQLQEDGLAQEDLPGLQAQASDLALRQLDVLPRPGTFNYETVWSNSVKVAHQQENHHGRGRRQEEEVVLARCEPLTLQFHSF